MELVRFSSPSAASFLCMASRVDAEPRCVRPVPVRWRCAGSGWLIGEIAGPGGRRHRDRRSCRSPFARSARRGRCRCAPLPARANRRSWRRSRPAWRRCVRATTWIMSDPSTICEISILLSSSPQCGSLRPTARFPAQAFSSPPIFLGRQGAFRSRLLPSGALLSCSAPVERGGFGGDPPACSSLLLVVDDRRPQRRAAPGP